MCLSVPAQLISIAGESVTRTGRVSLGGVIKEINLAYVPEAKVGDYVLVHVGFALSIIDEQEAQFVFDYIRRTSELESSESAPGKGEEGR